MAWQVAITHAYVMHHAHLLAAILALHVVHALANGLAPSPTSSGGAPETCVVSVQYEATVMQVVLVHRLC